MLPALAKSIDSVLGEQIEDAEEETFLVFSQEIPSGNLGFLDGAASSIEVTVGPHDFTISQSPGLLRSELASGTTGAVLWKVTPLFAAWLRDKENFLWKQSILSNEATILELGCGVSGLIGLSMAPLVSRYILTDQPYVMKLLRQNLTLNQAISPKSAPRRGKSLAKVHSNFIPETMKLDWEEHSAINVRKALGDDESLTLLVACDCIYNDFLVKPFVQMCLDICALQSAVQPQAPTAFLVAQQLRSDEVYLEWIRAMTTGFHVWRIPDKFLSEELRDGSGYVVHVAFKKDDHGS